MPDIYTIIMPPTANDNYFHDSFLKKGSDTKKIMLLLQGPSNDARRLNILEGALHQHPSKRSLHQVDHGDGKRHRYRLL